MNDVSEERTIKGAEQRESASRSPLAVGLRDRSGIIDRQRLSSIAAEALGGSVEAAREFFNGYGGFLDKAIAAFGREPAVLDVSSKDRPVLFVGDIHGDLDTLRKVLATFPPGDYTYLFLGDYVDRGKQGTEVLTALLANKLLHPESFIMLRGNHECPEWKRNGAGFPDEFGRKTGGRQLDRVYHDLFTRMPLAAVVDCECFAVHGGIPCGKTLVSELAALDKEEGERNPLILGMLWNDFWDNPKSGGNGRRGDGISYIGTDDVRSFLEGNGLRQIVRAHQNRYEGYSADKLVLTLLTTTEGANRHQRVALLEAPRAKLRLIEAGDREPSYPQSDLRVFR